MALSVPVAFDLPTLGQLLLLGIAFSIASVLFAWCLTWGKRITTAQLGNPIKCITVMDASLSVLFLLLGQGCCCGLGTNLISASFATGGSGIVPWDFALKFALTILMLSANYQGEEVTLLFAIGASGVFVAMPKTAAQPSPDP